MKVKQELEAKAAAALQGLGYSRLRGLIFLAPWSSKVVSHLVYMEWLNKYGERISVRIGVRHSDAEAFAVKIIRDYGHFASRMHIKDDLSHSFVNFSLGRLCSWPYIWSLDPAEVGIDACVKEISDCLEGKLSPLVEWIRCDSSMYDFLTRAQPMIMQPPNGAARAAEVIFIGKRLNYRQDRVFSDIARFSECIPSQIDKNMLVEDYLISVWARA
ncbi:hypothetical protein [Neotabrizicola sp. sgz301269]|uniref:hypothetical protein n=1 Tax=Neotabrizicola sp. sgz301269 TaxID=3276282 RepID=UPI00376F5BC4